MSTILGQNSVFMEKRKPPEAIHTWPIMTKASQAIARYAFQPLLAEGLGDSDFRVLDVLLHKGPMPVNAIGPKVDLNPGSVSVAVDRLYKKGLVSRVESENDRRVRTVSLTGKGRRVFVPIFPPARRSPQTCISRYFSRRAASNGRNAQENWKTRRRIGRTRRPPLGSCLQRSKCSLEAT